MAGRISAKDLIVLIIDVGPMMDVAPLMGEDTPLESSLKIASQIVTQKLFSVKDKSEVGIVLFGTPETDNILATEDNGGYDNISVVQQLAPPDIDMLKYIKGQVKMGGDNPADFIDAVVVGLDLIERASQEIPKVGDKKIYLFTSCGSHYSDDQLDVIVSSLKEKDIQLIVIGPSIDDDSDSASDGGDIPPHPPSLRPPDPDGCSSRLKKTPQQIAGEQVLQRVITATDGLAFTYHEALNIANIFLRTSKKQTTRFAGELCIGSSLRVPCKVFTNTMVERPSTWKKLSAISQSSRNPGTMAVIYDRSFQDEEEVEVEKENAVKGYRYGKSLIPVTSEDEEAMKLSADKCLSVLGFTSMNNVKPHHIIGSSVQVVVPNPDDQYAVTALSSLIHALYEMDMVGIVRYVFRKNSNPRLCALVPHIKPDRECLHMYQLPFTEDLRQYPFSSLNETSKFQPSDQQLQAIDELIDDMDLMEAERDDEGDLVEAVKTKNISNIMIQRTYQCIQHRALDKDEPLPDVEPFLSRAAKPLYESSQISRKSTISRLLEPPAIVQTKCKTKIHNLKGLFPLVNVEKTKKSSNPSEVWSKKASIDLEGEEPASKKAKITEDDETDFSMRSLARGSIEEVGTVDPIGDYEKLISRKDSNSFEEASKQLQSVALRLVKESFGNAMYNKALSCVKKLREEAIRHSKPELFNDFLKNTKDDLLGTRYSSFWDTIKEAVISLITNTECSMSNVTQDESKNFIADEGSSVIMEENEPEETEADDLLAMMD